MDIQELSMSLARTRTQDDLGVAMLSDAIDIGKDQGEALVSMIDKSAMELSVNPAIGSNFDVSV